MPGLGIGMSLGLGGGGGGAPAARSVKIETSKTGVVYSTDTGLKVPITVSRDSGSTAITFAASGSKITASIAAALASGASVSAIAKAVQADGAGVLIPVTLTGLVATPTPTPTPTPGVAVASPQGFVLAAPYVPTLYRTGTTTFTYSTDYDAAARKARIVQQATYYSSPTGSDNNNDGLSPGAKLKSLRLVMAMSKAGSVPVRLVSASALPGDPPVIYRDTDTGVRSAKPTLNATWGSAWKTDNPEVDIIIEPDIPGGVFYSIQDVAARPFAATSDPNIYVATGTSSQLPSTFVDFANRDPVNYAPRKLIMLTTAPADLANPWPELNALWAQYNGLTDGGTVPAYALGVGWRDATNLKVYIRTFNNRNPNADANFIWCSTSSNVVAPGIPTGQAAARKMYIEGFITVASVGQPAMRFTASGGFRHQVDLVRCGGISSGANGDGVIMFAGAQASDGCDVVLKDTFATFGQLDGFNYHGDCTVLEINCYANWNGFDAGLANNDSTLHDTCRAARWGGKYVNSQDRAIHDVYAVASWNVGLSVSTRRGADGTEQSTPFSCGHPTGQGSQNAVMWLDDCKVLNGPNGAPQYLSTVYGAVSSGTKINYANLSFTPVLGANPGNGTVAAYVP